MLPSLYRLVTPKSYPDTLDESRFLRYRDQDVPPLDEQSLPLQSLFSVRGLRWLNGILLTIFTAVGLIGGALWLSLTDDHLQLSFSTLQNTRSTDAVHGKTDRNQKIPKSDRLNRVQPDPPEVLRRIIPVSIVQKKGKRDIIQRQPYIFLATTLQTRPGKTSIKIPPFDPFKIFAHGPQKEPASEGNQIYTAHVQGKIAVEFDPITARAVPPGTKTSLPEKFIQTAALAHFFPEKTSASAATRSTIRTTLDIGRFDVDLTDQRHLENLDVRIFPENMSFIPRSSPRVSSTEQRMEQVIPVSQAQSLRMLLLQENVSLDDIRALTERLHQETGSSGALQEGDFVLLTYKEEDAEVTHVKSDLSFEKRKRIRLTQLSLYKGRAHHITLSRRGDTFVPAQAPVGYFADTPPQIKERSAPAYGNAPSLYESLYYTILAHDIPQTTLPTLLRIYATDFDLNTPLGQQSTLEIFYEKQENETEVPPEILYTSVKHGDETYRFYRFKTPDDGQVNYYDTRGHLAQNFLLRKPVAEGRFTSGFGMRRHPVLKTLRMHSGIDWAAPRGTPIIAAGDGTVLQAGWSSGYGYRIEIRHANGYITTYSHLSRFAKGLSKGASVRQGEVIGYIGSTGLSTGPHLHFEVKINQRFVDPMRIRVPKARILKGDVLRVFIKERDRIDALRTLGRGSALVAAYE